MDFVIGRIFLILVLFSVCVFCSQSFAQSIPEPKAKIHCSYDGNWYSPEEYRIYCKPSQQTPQIGPRTSPGLSPSQQMQLQMFQSIFQPLFNSIFNFGPLFAPPDISHKEAIRRQQEEERKRQEEKRKAIEAWQRHLEEAERQAKLEIERKKKAGQDILSQVRIGSGPFGSYTIIGHRSSEGQTSLSTIDWDNPRANSVSSAYSKTSEKAKEQLLRVAYFSKMAETSILNGDLEAARFWAGVAFEGDANSPRAINYTPPREILDAMDTKRTMEMNKKITQYSRFFKEALPKFDALQNIILKIEEISIKKKEKENKIREIEEQIKTAEIQNQQAKTPEEKAQASDLLARALSLKHQTEAELQNALKEEQKLIQEKQTIESGLKAMTNKLLAEAE